MKSQRMLPGLALAATLWLSGCGEPAPDTGAQGATTPTYERVESEPLFTETVTAVRIGELGPAFAACNARATTRDRVTTDPVPVRAAPFDQAQVIDELAPGAQFFICTRTKDQRWSGIVYDEGGTASQRCGVSSPVPSPRDYGGPCAAGWIATSATRLISGVPHQMPAESPPAG
jgi:hypothetical protein